MDYLILVFAPIIYRILFPYFYKFILIPFNIYANYRKYNRNLISAGTPDLAFVVLSIVFLLLFNYLYIGISSIYFIFILSTFDSKIIYYITTTLFFVFVPSTIWSKIVKYQDVNKKMSKESDNEENGDNEYDDMVKYLIKLEKNQYVDLFILNYLCISLLVTILAIMFYPDLIRIIWGGFPFVN